MMHGPINIRYPYCFFNLYKSLDSLTVMNLDVNTKTRVSEAIAVNVAAIQLLLSQIFTDLLISEGAAHRSLSISLKHH